MGARDLNVVRDTLPNIFEDWPVDRIIEPGGTVIPVDDPTIYDRATEEQRNQPADLDQIGADLLDEGLLKDWPQTGVREPGDFGGAPVTHEFGEYDATPDCLAFYLPWHFFYPDWWGVYLRFDGLLYLADGIQTRSNSAVPSRTAIQMARLFLYYHEAFHHLTECYAFRLEATHRHPIYKKTFVARYQKTFGTHDCLEEGLANAHALRKCAVAARRIGNSAIIEALREYVTQSPPGYSRGVKFEGRLFRPTQCEFAEVNQRDAVPTAPDLDPAIWLTSTHMFHGITNIKSRVKYYLPPGSPLRDRIPF